MAKKDTIFDMALQLLKVFTVGACCSLFLGACSLEKYKQTGSDDYMDLDLNLQDHLIQNPSATFCVRAVGESMKDAGIQSGDIMLVDKSITPKNRSIVLAVIDGEFTVKRLNVSEKELYLVPENENSPPIKITEKMDFQVWGVVTYIVHKAI